MELYQKSVPVEQFKRETQAEKDLKFWEKTKENEILEGSKKGESEVSADILDTNFKYFEKLLPAQELAAYQNEIAFAQSQKEYETEMTIADTQKILEKNHFAVEMSQNMSA